MPVKYEAVRLAGVWVVMKQDDGRWVEVAKLEEVGEAWEKEQVKPTTLAQRRWREKKAVSVKVDAPAQKSGGVKL